MKSLLEHLKSIKEILLYAYIWQIPFSWRVVFDPSRSQWNQGFSEYMDISLYVGEVLIAFALLTHILEYELVEKSILKNLRYNCRRLFHVEHNTFYLTIGIPLVSINLLLSIDIPLSLVSILHIASVIGFIFLFLRVYVSRGTKFVQNVFSILILSLIAQLIIAFLQVFNATSIGLAFLNESKLSLHIDNVAKSNIFSNTYLRAYGTFLHPNILSSYVLMVITFLIYIEQSCLFHVKHYLKILILLFSTVTIFLAQSKIALILLFFILFLYFNEKFRLFHVEQLLKFIAIAILVSVPSLIFLNSDARESFQTRISQFSLQFKFTQKEFFIGSGLGTYRLSYDQLAIDWWNYEPVHFIPLIVLKEFGIFISLGMIVYLVALIIRVPRETFRHTYIVGVFILYIVITDHFVWDIYQGTSFVAISFLIIYIDIYTNKCHNNTLESRFKY